MTERPYSITIIDDHPMVASGLQAIIKAHSDLHVNHVLNSGIELIELLEVDSPDLIILDISMKDMDGVQAAEIVRSKYPDQKILCISTFYQQSLYAVLKAIPVQGFIPKLTDTNTLIQGILKILAGEDVYIIQNDENIETKRLVLTEITNKLSRREVEIMKLIKAGKSSKEIADELFIALTTVSTHRKNISKKLNINDLNGGLLRFAIDNF